MSTIRSKPATDAYRDGWNRIFGKDHPKPTKIVALTPTKPSTPAKGATRARRQTRPT